MTTTKSYDYLNRLTAISSAPSASSTATFSHRHNNVTLQTTVTLGPDSSHWAYGCDSRRQVTSRKNYRYDGVPFAGQYFGYLYGLAGNLNYRTNNASVQTFNVNSLNELTNVTRSGTMTVAGLVWGTATNVTVNTSNATRYADGTSARTNLLLTDGTNTFTAVAKDSAGRTDTNTVKPYLPATVTFAYDANGNLVTNGTLLLGYDSAREIEMRDGEGGYFGRQDTLMAGRTVGLFISRAKENQLITITNSGAWKTDFVYDGKMRRRERWESVWDGSKWVKNLLVRYIYDGMLVIQERQYNPQLSTTSPQLIVTYTRGRDLSGTLQGAGGIGGLLARTKSGPLALGAPLATALYHSDNVGNIACLVATNGQVQARYLYEPFGTIIGMAGPMADRNLYRFSSKEWHENSGLVYFGYRYYSPALQQWANRDALGEVANGNLYGFVANLPTLAIDPYGLDGLRVPSDPGWWARFIKLLISICGGGDDQDPTPPPPPPPQKAPKNPGSTSQCSNSPPIFHYPPGTRFPTNQPPSVPLPPPDQVIIPIIPKPPGSMIQRCIDIVPTWDVRF